MIDFLHHRMRLVIVVALVAWSAVATAHPDQQGKACVACHEDAHHREFGAKPCGDCHTTTKFTPSTFDVAKHASTKYILDGKHVATPCSGCHTGGKPRTNFQIASSACLDCHTNPHGDKFANRPERACGDCHTTSTWKSWKVDHKSWPIIGGHQRVACTGCHPRTTIDTPLAQFRGVAKTCEGCHADVHATQFASTPAKACTACHTAEKWKTPFDHAQSRYPLEGVHVAMACATCHKPTTLRNGDSSTRWRLGYFQCKDCHGNPHPRVQLNCDGCHGATTWKPTGTGKAGFDHDATGFALRQTHAKAACAKCHDGKPKTTGARTNSACQTCHPDPHQGHMAGQCFECHTAVAWQDTAMFEQHRRTRMPLTGKHAVIECGGCHRRFSERGFRDLPTDCFGCHGKTYAAAANHPGRLSRECQLCHTTTAWDPALSLMQVPTATAHDAQFVISTGVHRSATCDSCHIDAKRTRAVRCDGCHDTSSMRSVHKQPVAATATTCLGCHPRGARR